GVVVVGDAPVVDCGVVVVVPVVDGVVSTVGGVAACPLTEPGVPAVPVPTAPVVPACGVTDPGVPAVPVPIVPVVPVCPVVPMVPVVAEPAVPLWPAPAVAPAPVLAPAPAPAPPACAYAKQPDSSNVPVIKNSFFVISRVTLRSSLKWPLTVRWGH